MGHLDGMQIHLLYQGLTLVSISLLLHNTIYSFPDGGFKPILIPKYSLCLPRVIIVLKNSQFPPGLNIIQVSMFLGYNSYTPYQ